MECLLREGFLWVGIVPLQSRVAERAWSSVLDSPSEAVKDAKVLITMLKDGPAVDEVVFVKELRLTYPREYSRRYGIHRSGASR